MRGSSANPILNPTGASKLWDASSSIAAAPISCSLRGGCAGLVAAVSVTLVGQGWGGSGVCLGGSLARAG